MKVFLYLATHVLTSFALITLTKEQKPARGSSQSSFVLNFPRDTQLGNNPRHGRDESSRLKD